MTNLEQTSELIALNKQVIKVIYKDCCMDKKDYTSIVVSGPSGVGKNTMINHLTKAFPDKFDFSVSYTTRAPRGKEVDGVDYHFVSKEEF